MDLTTAPPTTDQGWQSRAGREITISEEAYVSGVLALGWPDGDWSIKLPNAEMITVEVKNGITPDLALFVWNSLSPSARISVQPPTEHSPGVLSLASRPGIGARAPQPHMVIPRDDLDDSDEISLRAIRQAVDRLGPPVQFEHVWAFLSDRGVDLPPGQLIALIRRLFHVDNLGVVRTHDDGEVENLNFRPDDCEWDNVEQAYWELHNLQEPPYLERMYRKRKSSIHDGLEYHLDEIRHRLLTAKQEEDLGNIIREGQEAAKELHLGVADFDRKVELGLAIRAADYAREEFQKHNLRLAFNIALKFRGQLTNTALGLDDLVQAGYIGLMRAVEKFDPNLGFKFSTYATWWIKQSISRHLADTSRTIRLPVLIHDKLQGFRQHNESLLVELGRPPSMNELVRTTGLSNSDVRAIEGIQEVTTLTSEDDVQHDSEWNDHPLLQAVIRQETLAVIRSSVSTLNDRMARVLMLRFGLDGKGHRTLEEIGHEFGVTRERIRQLETKALASLAKNPHILQLLNGAESDDLAPPTRQSATPLTEEQEAAWEKVRVRAGVLEALKRE